MSHLPFILPLLLSLQIHALEINSHGKNIELSGNNCKENLSIVKTLEDWTKNKCQRVEDSKCSFNITECLPKHIAGVVGKYSGYEGPNCWNLALVMRGILPGLRFSSEEEMAFYMNSPLCRSLDENEERRPGDIGAIRELIGKKANEFHGFVYISDEIVFSKNGMTHESSYDLQTLEHTYASYRITSNDKCRGNQINFNSTCMNGTAFFRCESLDEYLSKRKPLPPLLSRFMRETSVFEKCALEPFLIDSKPLDKAATRSLSDMARALAIYTEGQIKNNHQLSEEEKFILTSLDLRIRSIAEQLTKSFRSEEANSLNFR